MTSKQLEKFGLIHDSVRTNGRRYWCNTTQTHMTIPPSYNASDVVEMIFEEGRKQGIETGKEIRSKEFKDLINNTI